MMNMPGSHELATALGGMAADLKNMSRDMGEVKKDVKCFAKFQAQTEERLRSGTESFQTIDNEIGCLDQRVDGVVESHAALKARVPRGWVVYAMLVIGFALVSFLIALRGNGAPIAATNQATAAEITKNDN